VSGRHPRLSLSFMCERSVADFPHLKLLSSGATHEHPKADR
jgi:hypothetical protein